jgi:hypothetical protein
MPSASKIVTLPGPREALRPELREFLDTVVVPALLRKIISEIEAGESNFEESLAPLAGNLSYSRPVVRSAARRKS